MNDIKNKILKNVKLDNCLIGFYANNLKGIEIAYNENLAFESASCIKVFILVEYYRQIHEGIKNKNDILEYTSNMYTKGSGIFQHLDIGVEMSSKNLVYMMIIASDNIAVNILINYLGIENINNTIRSLGFKVTKLLNKIDFSKYTTMGITTPKEYYEIFRKIYYKELFSENISNEILEVLKKQQEKEMLLNELNFVDSLPNENPIKYIASKSGGFNSVKLFNIRDMSKNVRNDGGIISTIYGDYIICIFITNFDTRNNGIKYGGIISKNVYDFFKNLGQ